MMETPLPAPPVGSRPQPSTPQAAGQRPTPSRAAPVRLPPKPHVKVDVSLSSKRSRPVITVVAARPMSEVGFRDAGPSPPVEKPSSDEAAFDPSGGRRGVPHRNVACGVVPVRKRPVPVARSNINRPPKPDDPRGRPASMDYDSHESRPLPSRAPVNESSRPVPSPRPRKTEAAFLSDLNQRLGVAPSVTTSSESLSAKETEDQSAEHVRVPKSQSFPQGIPVFPVLPQPHYADENEHRPAPAFKPKPFLLPKPALKPKPGLKPKPTAAVKPVSVEPDVAKLVDSVVDRSGPMKATYRPTIIRAAKPPQAEKQPKPIRAVSTFDISKTVEDEIIPRQNEVPKKRGPTIIRPKSMMGALSMPNIAQACEEEAPRKAPAPRPRSRVFGENEVKEGSQNMTNQVLLAQMMTGSAKPPPPESIFREPEEAKKPPPPRPKAPPPSRPSAPPSVRSPTPSEVPVAKQEPKPQTTGEVVKLRTRSTPKPVRPVSGPAPNRPLSQPKRIMPAALPPRPGPGHPLFHYMLSGPHAIALFDYEASRPDELSFQAGDVISLEKSVGAEWMKGSIGSMSGMFPVNFVDVKQAPTQHEDAVKPVPHEEIQQAVKASIEGPRCKARFDYDGGEDGDLMFSAGDDIALLARISEEWLRGQCQGQIGLFPASFVDIIEDLVPQESVAERPPNVVTTLHNFIGENGELSFTAGADVLLLGRVNDDWLYGRLYEQEGTFPAGFVDRIPENLPQHREDKVEEKSEVKREVKSEEEPQMFFSSVVDASRPHCLAVHSFSGQTTEDLSFDEGQLIELLSHVDADWLKGSVNGHEGIFPAAFVEIVKDVTPEGLPPRPTPAPSLGTVTALHDFPGEETSDLSFAAGDKITVLSRINESWLMGRIGDREGEFPQGFVDASELSA